MNHSYVFVPSLLVSVVAVKVSPTLFVPVIFAVFVADALFIVIVYVAFFIAPESASVYPLQ